MYSGGKIVISKDDNQRRLEAFYKKQNFGNPTFSVFSIQTI